VNLNNYSVRWYLTAGHVLLLAVVLVTSQQSDHLHQ